MSPPYDILLFDLDGTLIDPILGIGRSLNHALRALGFSKVPEADIAELIGLPLDEIFPKLTQDDSGRLISQLVKEYRDRFSRVGYREHSLYPGVRESLNALHEREVPMAVCTSKPSDPARKILRMFQLDSLFQFIDGGDVGIRKGEQIARLLDDGTISRRSMMIGDRALDLTAAHSNGIDSAGVLWGYGSREELERENPSRLFRSPQEWLGLTAA